MQIYIMRHGQAIDFAASDEQRPLSEQGSLEAKLMAKWLRELAVEFDQVYVSPFMRAQQTAETVMAILPDGAKSTILDLITPSGDASAVHDFIDGVCTLEHFDRILLVSHMPLVSYLVAELTMEHDAPIFQTAAIAIIDYDQKRMKGHLQQLVAPSELC